MNPLRSASGDADDPGTAAEAESALEAELRALHPQPFPPALTARIGRDIAVDTRRRGWVMAGLGLAASVAVALVVWRAGTRPGGGPDTYLPIPPPPPLTSKPDRITPA